MTPVTGRAAATIAQQREGGVERSGSTLSSVTSAAYWSVQNDGGSGRTWGSSWVARCAKTVVQRLERVGDVEQLVLDEQDEINDVANAASSRRSPYVRVKACTFSAACRLTSMSSTDRAPMPAKLSELGSMTRSVASSSALPGATSSFMPPNCLPASDA